ncbi:MAG TPA: BrnT family toxin [Acetobacteraceae bacterium]|nr:BrnT family toxin [Acetobacteraceae bacterium]
MLFTWDPGKERRNVSKHGLDFSFAAAIFADPLAVTLPDHVVEGEERWHTIRAIAAGPIFRVLLVVHTYPDDETWIRGISLREAEPRERRRYDREH